jgi:hypothetical protein
MEIKSITSTARLWGNKQKKNVKSWVKFDEEYILNLRRQIECNLYIITCFS